MKKLIILVGLLGAVSQVDAKVSIAVRPLRAQLSAEIDNKVVATRVSVDGVGAVEEALILSGSAAREAFESGVVAGSVAFDEARDVIIVTGEEAASLAHQGLQYATDKVVSAGQEGAKLIGSAVVLTGEKAVEAIDIAAVGLNLAINGVVKVADLVVKAATLNITEADIIPTESTNFVISALVSGYYRVLNIGYSVGNTAGKAGKFFYPLSAPAYFVGDLAGAAWKWLTK